MRMSKKKVVLFAVMLLVLISLVWGIIYLKSVTDSPLYNLCQPLH